MTDFSEIDAEQAETEGSDFRPEPPPVVAGRVLEADADFLAYHCGYRWEEESVEKSIETLKLEIETLRIMAGAETIQLHLTMGTKGGRYELAVVKEYQGKREKTEGLAARVSELRHFMANYKTPTCSALVSLDQEADDALCQALIAARDNGTKDLHVLWSLDKDLFMVPGLHMNHKTYEITDYPDGYGESWLDDSTSSKKVVGKGTSFFWHQLLMGDGADDIPGLPYLSADICMQLMPTKKLVDAEARLRAAKTTAKATAARKALRKVIDAAKPKLCGAVTAHKYLERATTDKQAFHLVRCAYEAHYGPGQFNIISWDNRSLTLTAGDMLLEQARLLWMRRYKDEDVMDFFKEVMQ